MPHGLHGVTIIVLNPLGERRGAYGGNWFPPVRHALSGDAAGVAAKQSPKRLRVPGGIAQLGEHLLCTQGVSGSSPLISTNGPIAQLVRAHD